MSGAILADLQADNMLDARILKQDNDFNALLDFDIDSPTSLQLTGEMAPIPEPGSIAVWMTMLLAVAGACFVLQLRKLQPVSE